jgi:hypothetical protein
MRWHRPGKSLRLIIRASPISRRSSAAIAITSTHFGLSICYGSENATCVDWDLWSYKCDAVEPSKFVASGGIIIEVRGDRQLAVFPGSIHESGELISFEEGRDFSSIPKVAGKHELELGIDMVLIATVLYKRWITGDRRSLALNASKCLLSAGWTQGAVEHLFTLVAKQAGDDEIDCHLAAIQSAMDATYKAGRSGLIACMGVEGVADIEASLCNIDEWRNTHCLDTPRFNFAPCKGFPRGRPLPAFAS